MLAKEVGFNLFATTIEEAKLPDAVDGVQPGDGIPWHTKFWRPAI